MSFKTLARNLLAALSVLVMPLALAVGTPAGTSISNQAYVDYSDANGNSLTRVNSNTVITLVTQVAGVAILPASKTLADGNSKTVYFDFDIENTGNGTDSFSFSYAQSGSWTPDSVTFYADVNDNGIYDVATDTLIGSGAGPHTGGPIAADSRFAVLMAVAIPAAAADASTMLLDLTATSTLNGAVSATGSYTTQVAAAVVTAFTSFTASPNPPEPGTVVTYSVTLNNTGSVAANSVVLSNLIPAGMTYNNGSMTLNSIGQTDPNDVTDNADFNISTSNAITLALGSIGLTDTITVTFQATVNAALPAGTTVESQATVNYTTGGNPVSQTSNTVKFTVATSPSLTITANATSQLANPGDTSTFTLTIVNSGNATDVIDLTYSSSTGMTYSFWIDANGDGIAGNDGDFLLTDSDGDGVIDTGNLPAGSSLTILVVTTIPVGTANGTLETLVVTGTSSNNPSISNSSGNLTTTVTAPVLVLFKTVSPTGTQPPGTELVYTITATNSGSGLATKLIITDLVPTFTTYQAASIKTGTSLGSLTDRTDAADGDGGTYDGGSRTVTAGGTTRNLGAGGTFILRFSVIID